MQMINEVAFDTKEPKSSMKEDPKTYTNPFSSDKENDKVNLWNGDKLNLPAKPEEEKIVEPSIVPEGPKELYIDKNETECQLPEWITCDEDNCYHVVKDICVDEGLSHGEKVDCDKEHHELSCSPIAVNGDKHDKLKSFIVNSSENCGPEDSTQNGEEKLDASSNSLNNSIKIVEPSNNDINDVDQQFSEVQSVGNEAIELRETSQTIDLSNEIKTEETTISNTDNVKPATVVGPLELPPEPQSEHNNQYIASNDITVTTRDVGEASFSMAGSALGLITYSGPITYSGSISHRSDGSNTSVRSFAFPILHNEWNSSPVRMATVDDIESPKHRGWRQSLMCCRF